MYCFQKLARKHRPALVTAAIALCLVLGNTINAWQVVYVTTSEAQATANGQTAVASEQKAVSTDVAARENDQELIKQRDEVKALADKLAAELQQLQRTLYTAHMNLARHAWEADAMNQMVEMLEEHRPRRGKSDLRGFEWHYLQRLRHSDLLTLRGHTAGVRSVAYSSDGKRLASASDDKTVMVWDALNGEVLRVLAGHSGAVKSVVFSPDGKRLASGGGEKSESNKLIPGEVKIWDAETGLELHSFQGHTSVVNCVAFSPDGKRLASGSGEWGNTPKPELKMWDTQTGEELHTCKEHNDGILHVAFSPDGKRLASYAYDETVKVWDAQSGQELLSYAGGAGGLAFSPDGKGVTGDWGVTDVETGQELLSIDVHTSRRMIYSPDGNRLLSLSNVHTVRLWNTRTGHELFSIKGHTGKVNDVAFSPDGNRLALANDDGTVSIRDVTDNPENGTFGGHEIAVSHLAYSPDGKLLATASLDKTVKVWDVQTGKELLSLTDHPDIVLGVAFSPDGQRLASASADNTVKMWDARSGQEVRILKGGGRFVAYSPDGQRLVSPSEDGTVKVWNTQTGQVLLTLRMKMDGSGHPPIVVVYSLDGKRIACARRSAVTVWDAHSGEEILSLQGGSGCVAFSPDGKRLASGGKMWDAATGQELLSLKGLSGAVWSVAYSPDGKRLATKAASTVKVWDAETGQEMLSLRGGVGHGVVFSPDGHHLAAIGRDVRVKIWDATPLPEKP